MEQLLLENEVKVGDIVKGEVIAINGKELVLDIKQFAEGHMYINEYAPNLDSFEGVLEVGSVVECVVMKISENDSHSAIYLSRLPMIRKENNEKMDSLCNANDVINVKITKIRIPRKKFIFLKASLDLELTRVFNRMGICPATNISMPINLDYVFLRN